MRILDVLFAFAIVCVLAVVAELVLRKEVLSGAAVVVDGDSLKIQGTAIRLQDVDAPELRQPCGGDGQNWPCGAAARDALSRLVRGKDVFCTSGSQDRYGRAVARCTVDGRDLGGEMVRQGLAVAHRGGDYGADEAEARAARRGIWAGPFELPADYRAAHPRGAP